MSERLSWTSMQQLQESARASTRSKERLGTLARLEEACDSVASGAAVALIERYLPEAKHHYRHRYTQLRPDRIEEFVRARRSQDAEARRSPSAWTGPTAVTIRKDKSLLAYVRMRSDEQVASHDAVPAASRGVEAIIAGIPDEQDRARLRLSLGRGEEAKIRVSQLEKTLRALSPLSASGLMPLTPPSDAQRDEGSAGSSGRATQMLVVDPSQEQRSRDESTLGRLVGKFSGLRSDFSLAAFGLEYVPTQDRVLQKQLREEFIEPEEMAALRRAAKGGAD